MDDLFKFSGDNVENVEKINLDELYQKKQEQDFDDHLLKLFCHSASNSIELRTIFHHYPNKQSRINEIFEEMKDKNYFHEPSCLLPLITIIFNFLQIIVTIKYFKY